MLEAAERLIREEEQKLIRTDILIVFAISGLNGVQYERFAELTFEVAEAIDRLKKEANIKKQPTPIVADVGTAFLLEGRRPQGSVIRPHVTKPDQVIKLAEFLRQAYLLAEVQDWKSAAVMSHQYFLPQLKSAVRKAGFKVVKTVEVLPVL